MLVHFVVSPTFLPSGVCGHPLLAPVEPSTGYLRVHVSRCRVILFNKADYGRCAQHFLLVDKNKQAASRQTYCNGVPQGPASDGQKQKHQQISSDLVGLHLFLL